MSLSNELLPINISDLEVVKNDMFPPMFTDFNVCKKVGNYSAVLDNTVLHLLPSFSRHLNQDTSEEPQCHIHRTQV